MALRHTFSEPDRFVVGAIGEVADRVYVLQVREDRRLLTMPCDPTQLQALANHVERVLDEIEPYARGIIDVPPATRQARDLDPLDVPIEEDFTVATMAIGWDALLHALHLELFSEAGSRAEPVDTSLTGEELAAREAQRAQEMASITLSPVQGREFVARARSVLAADLTTCPFCAQPLRAAGHICPRRNGYLGRSAWQPGSGEAG